MTAAAVSSYTVGNCRTFDQQSAVENSQDFCLMFTRRTTSLSYSTPCVRHFAQKYWVFWPFDVLNGHSRRGCQDWRDCSSPTGSHQFGYGCAVIAISGKGHLINDSDESRVGGGNMSCSSCHSNLSRVIFLSYIRLYWLSIFGEHNGKEVTVLRGQLGSWIDCETIDTADIMSMGPFMTAST